MGQFSILLPIICAVIMAASVAGLSPMGLPLGHNRGYKAMSSNSADHVVEIYGDPMCPDTRDAMYQLETIAGLPKYSTLNVRFVLTPLAFHHNSFLTCQALQGLEGESFYTGLFNIFKNQESLGNAANLDSLEARKTICAYVGASNSTASANCQANLLNADTKRAADIGARKEWSFSVIRGVNAVPTFSFNGIPLTQANNAIDFGSMTANQMETYLDTLFGF